MTSHPIASYTYTQQTPIGKIRHIFLDKNKRICVCKWCLDWFDRVDKRKREEGIKKE
jgi:hypothetical protein